MIKLSAEKILNHYKTDLNITNKDQIIEDFSTTVHSVQVNSKVLVFRNVTPD